MKIKIKPKQSEPKETEIEKYVPQVVQVVESREKSGASITMSSRRSLPTLMDNSPVDLVAEDEQLSKLPRFSCNSCHIGADCPEYRPGFVCAYEGAFKAFPVRSADAVMAIMREVAESTKIRFRRARLTEDLVSGGNVDPQVTKLGEVLMSQLGQLAELSASTDTVNVTVMGEQTGGILSRLFGSEPVKQDVIELNPAPEEKILDS